MAKMKKILSLVLALCMCCSLFAVQAFADGEEPVYVAKIGENSYETLAAAVAVGGEIELLKDVELDAAITVALDTTIKGAYTITRAAGYTGTLFSVSKGATLTLDGGVILDGGNNWTFNSKGYYDDMAACVFDGASTTSTRTYSTSNGIEATTYMITVSGANSSVVMNSATIQNNWGAPLFCVSDNGSLTTNEGSLIHHIRGRIVGTLTGGSGMFGGTWTMNGGKIDGVHGHNTNGGLASIRDNSVVNINGGEITNVTTLGLNANGNGILFEVYGEKSKLNINGGWIHGNASFSPGNGWGAAVYLNRGGDFTMTGGVIEDTKSDICTAFVSNTATSIELLGGTIEVNNDTHTTRFESLFCGDVVIGENMNIVGEDGAIFLMLGEVSGDKLDIDGQVSGEGTMWLMPIEPVTGEGTVTSDVLVKTHNYYPAADVTLTGANWNCLITVDSVGSEATLFVKPGANVTDGLVRVLESVPSGNYLNGEESAAAQASAYVEDDGANVTSPVLYYHRLTDAQKSAIVVTYDYNGGLDAQGWSGVQMTGESPYDFDHPAPTYGKNKLVGWELNGELLTADSTDASITLVAKWAMPEYVAEIVETGVKYETLTEAVAAANAAEGANTIKMLKSINFDSTKALAVTGDLTIIGEKTISRGNYTGTLFTVPAGSSLTLDGGIVFDGSNNWIFDKALYENDLYNYLNNSIDKYAYSANGGTCGTAAVFVVNGAMTVEDATIQNFFNTKDSNGGDGAIFKVNANATLTMDGALIDHVATYGANSVAHLATNAKWYIEGDTVIRNNFGGRNGGVCRNDSGQIYMNGGTIKDNAGKNVNGSVFMMYGKGSAFYMTDGTISGNSSVFGANNGRCAAVYLHSQSYMKMTGGTICNNIGGARGGIDSYSSSSVLDINRVDQTFVDGVYAGENLKDAYVASNHPMIVDNVSLLDNTNHDIGHSYNFDTWWVTGGIYTQDVDDFCAKGYVCIPYEDTERTDDYIVVPGYRVSYYSVEETTVTDPETNEPKTEYATTLEAKRFLLLPEDKFWHEVTLYAEDLQLVDDETHSAIKGWHSDVELTQDYDFNTPVEDNIKLYGEWEKTAYEVSYVVDGKTVEKYVVDIGAVIPDYAGETPTKAQTGNTTYRFDKWVLVSGTPDGSKIGSTDLVYEADFSDIKLSNDKYVDIPENIPIAPVPEVFTDDHYAYVIGYPDGTVRPSASITRAEVATIFFRLLDDEVRAQFMTTENDFSDVNEGAWYNTAISTMAAMGIVNGYEDGSFQPNKSITRAEFATIAARFDLEATDEGNYFSDISGHWAESDICKAVNNGWVKGYEDGTFRPNELIKRAEAMTLINRVLHRLPASADDLLEGMVEWSDNANPDAWYYIAIQEATNSHEYSRETEESETETWLELIENRNWAELQ